MKVQCDFCGLESASVFCCADEAALCDSCDRRVHRANKLAGKHRRFSLLHPSSSHSSTQPPPLCDICQEKRGFLFCKEDRAILCRDCDVPIHTASDLTLKHSRFLLTGVRLSSAPIPSSTSPSMELEKEVEKNSSHSDDQNSCYDNRSNVIARQQEAASNSFVTTATTDTVTSNQSSSSISEYLMNTLPGWHVEDLLIDYAATVNTATTNSLIGGIHHPSPPVSVSTGGFYQYQGGMKAHGLGDGFPMWVSQEQSFYNNGNHGMGQKDARFHQVQERWVPQIYNSQLPPYYYW